MKKLLTGLLVVGSFSSFASDYTCVRINDVYTGIDVGEGEYVMNTLCAEIDGVNVRNPFLEGYDDEGVDNVNSMDIALGYRLKKEASLICHAFSLQSVTKRKHIKSEDVNSLEDSATTMTGKQRRIGFRSGLLGQTFSEIICK